MLCMTLVRVRREKSWNFFSSQSQGQFRESIFHMGYQYNKMQPLNYSELLKIYFEA